MAPVNVRHLRQGIGPGRAVAGRHHGNDITDPDNLTGPGRLLAYALPVAPGARPGHLVHRDVSACARGKADTRPQLIVSQHQREFMISEIGRSFDPGEPFGPVETRLEMINRSPPSVPTVVVLDAPAECFLRDILKSGIQSRANGKTSLVQSAFPVTCHENPPHFFREIPGAHEPRFAARADGQRLGRSEFSVGRTDESVGRHSPEDPVSPGGRSLAVSNRMIIVGCLRQCSQIRGFRQRQLVEGLVEIVQRRGRHAVRAETQVNLVEVELQNLILGERSLDAEGEDRFPDLALDREFIRQQEILRHLLGDGRRANGGAGSSCSSRRS